MWRHQCTGVVRNHFAYWKSYRYSTASTKMVTRRHLGCLLLLTWAVLVVCCTATLLRMLCINTYFCCFQHQPHWKRLRFCGFEIQDRMIGRKQHERWEMKELLVLLSVVLTASMCDLLLLRVGFADLMGLEAWSPAPTPPRLQQPRCGRGGATPHCTRKSCEQTAAQKARRLLRSHTVTPPPQHLVLSEVRHMHQSRQSSSKLFN
jgi:hypothetical protein